MFNISTKFNFYLVGAQILVFDGYMSWILTRMAKRPEMLLKAYILHLVDPSCIRVTTNNIMACIY